MRPHLSRIVPLGFLACTALIEGCSSSPASTPVPGVTATPTPAATATPTPAATTTPTPAATATPVGYAFGGSKTTGNFSAGIATTVNLSPYMGVAASIAFPAATSPSTFSLDFADAVNNGDITPAGFVADNATAGTTPILYFSITNSTSTDDVFTSNSPAFTITDTNASFASFATCELDVYAQNGGTGFAWRSIASGSRSGTSVTVPSVALGATQTLDFRPGQQLAAISCN